jgi:hypothetical protein
VEAERAATSGSEDQHTFSPNFLMTGRFAYVDGGFPSTTRTRRFGRADDL